MERENMSTGVTVIGSEVPSNYHVAPRGEGPIQENTSPTMAMSPTGTRMGGMMEKKKRGRPRKYGPDGAVTSRASTLGSASPSSGNYSSGKRGKLKGASADTNQQARVHMGAIGEGIGHADGANFTPHIITVNPGEDVTAKIISFCQQGPRAVCILSANGMVSNATLRQSDSSGGTLTYEGRFEIVNLSGSYTPAEREGARYRAGGLSVSLSSPNGQVVGGCLAGLLIAASPVQIIVGSFLPSQPPEQKPKKQKAQATTPMPFTITAAPPPSASSGMATDEGCNGQARHTGYGGAASGFERDNWPPTTHTLPDLRKSATDINISLPGGM